MQFPRRSAYFTILFYSGWILAGCLCGGFLTPRWAAVAQSLTARPVAPGTQKTQSKLQRFVSVPEQTVVPLTSGTAQTGTINGGTTACVFSPTQYSITTTADTKRLLLSLSGNQDVDLYVRYNSPLVLQGGQLVFDYSSDSADMLEEIAVTPHVLPPSTLR